MLSVVCAFLFSVGCFMAIQVSFGRKRFFRTRPAARVKHVKPDSSTKENRVAALLVRVGELKEASQTWPALFDSFNPNGSPQIRTLLLELRQILRDDPLAAVGLIEDVCLYSPKPNDSFGEYDVFDIAVRVSRTNVDLSERASVVSDAWKAKQA